MPRPPSQHGLERKYKPWRRGKSATSKSKKGSLKNQLRGYERLLSKVTSEESRKGLEDKIVALRQEIEEKQAKEKERQNARKNHGIRFLERQKLTRMEKGARKRKNTTTTTTTTKNNPLGETDEELYRIALDQVYVAHYPQDFKYRSLFRNGVRRVDTDGRFLKQRAMTRRRILQNLDNMEPVGWISSDQYARVPRDWSVQLEKETFGSLVQSKEEDATATDERFSLASGRHAEILDTAEQIELAMEREEATMKQQQELEEGKIKSNHQQSASGINDGDSKDDSDDSSKSDDDGSSPEDDAGGAAKVTHESSAASSDDSSSSSSSEDSDDDEEENGNEKSDGDTKNEQRATEKRDDEVMEAEDDFLIPANPQNTNAFENANQDSNKLVAGDKSKGWATQRQRPGQWKKRKRKF